ncbi:MAG TPA: hypothetical protein VK837_07520 [Longimicrobiales bacterium]|nr:hypothetical protein [Longimicrobiales bacterium]
MGGVRLAGAAVLVLVAPLPLLAQSGEDAVRTNAEYTEYLKASDWEGAATMMHPDALGQIRELVGLLTQADPSGQVATMLFGDAASSPDEATDEHLFASFLGFAMEQAGLGAALASMEQDPIGHLFEGDTVHVVSRTHMSVEGISVSQVEVTSLVAHEGEWRMLLDAQIEAFLAGMRKELGIDADALVN